MDPENIEFEASPRLDDKPPASFFELVEKLEGRVDTQEQLIANLMMAYAEMWAAMESLVGHFLETKTPEEQTEFMKDFREFRQELLKNLKQATENGLENFDPELFDAVGKMATGQ